MVEVPAVVDTGAQFQLSALANDTDPAGKICNYCWTSTRDDVELTDPTIRQHVAEGMNLTHLGVVFEEHLSCVMTENGTVGKLKFVTGEAVDTSDHEDPLARQDAEFALLTGSVRRLLESLKKLLGGYEARAG